MGWPITLIPGWKRKDPSRHVDDVERALTANDALLSAGTSLDGGHFRPKSAFFGSVYDGF
jgi:hypothetical protein